MGDKSKGQTAIERAVKFLQRYVALPAGDSMHANPEGVYLVMALFAASTWIIERLPVTAYLCLSGRTKGCGKTVTMEAVGMLCQNFQQMATLRTLALVRMIGAFDGKLTYGLDEAEVLARPQAGDDRAIMTSGYRKGGKHGISSGKEFVTFKTYCAKIFALIGDVVDVVRDRSFVVLLERLTPKASLLEERTEAEAEAEAIVHAFKSGAFDAAALVYTMPEFLKDRDKEIGGALWTTALALHLDARTMKTLTAALSELAGLKRAEARSYLKAQAAESGTSMRRDAEQVVRDLVSVLPEADTVATGNIHTAVAIEKLKALPEGGLWRTYEGVGLSPDTLAALLASVGVTVDREVRMVRGRGGKLLKGYSGDDLRAAAARLKAEAGA